MLQIKKDIEILKVLYKEETNNSKATDLYYTILLMYEKLNKYGKEV